ncbi:hypothetical protein BDV33DRAFT_184538 [Aspergillus novoparasiticus]|uniref:Uncharacterized protein n=1 Tax=Aspergillus novoparasiticus TaxID=986946 RepID=A0A5N6E7L5_9EURO|nr:hypothetical protein BDV33DRAFT_184538 [Aspergillus novoparasiticus]
MRPSLHRLLTILLNFVLLGMGLAESKAAVTQISTACFEAECQGHVSVIELLSDNAFLILLNRIWNQIPPTTRKHIQKVNGCKSKRPSKRPSAQSKIAPSMTLLESIPHWKNNVQSFFTTDGALQLNLACPITGLYNFLLLLEQRGEKDTWRTRFLKVIIHRLLRRVCGQYTRSIHVERAIRIVKKSGIVRDDSDLIGERITDWGKCGRRLELLCEDLNHLRHPTNDRLSKESHLGFLFHLPSYMTDDYIRKIPLKKSTRKIEIQRLHDGGLCRNAQDEAVDELAQKIFTFLWDKIERSIAREDFVSHEGPSSSHQPVSTAREKISGHMVAHDRRDEPPDDSLTRPVAKELEVEQGSNRNRLTRTTITQGDVLDASGTQPNPRSNSTGGPHCSKTSGTQGTQTSERHVDASPADHQLSMDTSPDYPNVHVYSQGRTPPEPNDEPFQLHETANHDYFNALPYIQNPFPLELNDETVQPQETANQGFYRKLAHAQNSLHLGFNDQPIPRQVYESQDIRDQPGTVERGVPLHIYNQQDVRSVNPSVQDQQRFKLLHQSGHQAYLGTERRANGHTGQDRVSNSVTFSCRPLPQHINVGM